MRSSATAGLKLTPENLVIAHIGATLDAYLAACTPAQKTVSPELIDA